MELSFITDNDSGRARLVRHRSTIFFWFVLIGTSLVCPSVHAQVAPSGSSDGHKLTLDGTWFGSYTNNVLADLSRGGAGVPGVAASDFGVPSRGQDRQNAGLYTGLHGSLAYGYARQKAQTSFTMNARTKAAYFPDLDIRTVQHTANVTASRPLGRRTRARFAQSAHVSDHYRLELFPDITSEDSDAVVSLGDEYAVIARKTYAYVSMANVSQQLTRRSSLGVNYRFRHVHSPEGDFDLTSHNAGTSFQYQLTRYGAFHVGYNYREVPHYSGLSSQNPEQAPFQSHNANLGIDYNRAFSLSGRRTSLTFTTGSSLVATGRAEEQGEQTISSSHLRPFLQGSASLRRNLGRTWDAQAGYRRMVLFVEGFTQPIFADGASGGVIGQVGSYLTINAVIGYSSGTIGRSRSSGGNSYSSTTASAQFARPVINNLEAFIYYFYIRQLIDKRVFLPAGFPHSLNRHSVRVGLSYRLPLIS